MVTKTLLTKESLLDLINKSDAVKLLTQSQLLALLKTTANPNSTMARKVFDALCFEISSYKKIRQEYLSKTAELYKAMPEKVAQVKQQKLLEELQSAEEKAEQIEKETVQNILNTL